MNIPPFTSIVAPVTNEERSEAKNKKMFPISVGLAHPLRHTAATRSCSTSAEQTFRTGVRTPRPSHAAERASKTCHAVVASPVAAVPNAVTT
jgi:hypothetical protein